jgi:two-component system phosphate regulon sensor histidine kinase PhoR
MKIRLQWKLTLIFCSFISIVLIIVCSYTSTHLKDYLEQRIQNNLKRELYLSRDIIEDELSRGITLAGMNKLAHEISQSLGLRVTIISLDGKIESDSEMSEEGLLSAGNHLDRPEVRSASVEGFGQSKRFSTTKKIHMLYMALPLKNIRTVGFLRFSMPLSDLEFVTSKMRKIIVAAFVLALILTLVFGYFISFMVSRPILEMLSIAKNLAKGDFSRKIRLRQKDEIGDLAHALNYMSAELKNKMSKIIYEEAKLDAVISSMFEGVLITDEKGRVLMMNPTLRKLFLVDSAPEGKRPIEIMRNNIIQDIVDAIIKDQKRITTEEVFANISEEKIMKISGGPIVKNGLMEGSILVFHDITELKKLERVRQDFVANVSHELKTPLSNIKGYAETLLGGALNDKSNSHDFTGIIYRESDRLAKLIEDLLDLSGIESGKMRMVLLPINIGQTLRKVSDILNRSVRDKRIKLEISVLPGTPLILANEGRITQVLLNLIDNAIKFTSEDGSIKISVYGKDGFVQVDISDTGVGIPEKDIPRIFERFYRVDKAHSRDLGGTGLGLSIVKHIVQAHKGEVWVASIPGQGSTFSFTIPAA